LSCGSDFEYEGPAGRAVNLERAVEILLIDAFVRFNQLLYFAPDLLEVPAGSISIAPYFSSAGINSKLKYLLMLSLYVVSAGRLSAIADCGAVMPRISEIESAVIMPLYFCIDICERLSVGSLEATYKSPIKIGI
jgi:hypothetical protein